VGPLCRRLDIGSWGPPVKVDAVVWFVPLFEPHQVVLELAEVVVWFVDPEKDEYS